MGNPEVGNPDIYLMIMMIMNMMMMIVINKKWPLIVVTSEHVPHTGVVNFLLHVANNYNDHM